MLRDPRAVGQRVLPDSCVLRHRASMPSGQGPTNRTPVSRLIATAPHEAFGPWVRMAAPESGRRRVARNDRIESRAVRRPCGNRGENPEPRRASMRASIPLLTSAIRERPGEVTFLRPLMWAGLC